MKRAAIWGTAVVVLLMTASTSFAGHRHHRHHHHGYGRAVRVISNYGGYGYGGSGFGRVNVPGGFYSAPPFQYGAGYGGYNGYSYSPPVTQWHDTSHYDYHPGYAIPHGDHVDVVPGHYDYHPSGHYDTYVP